jgi:hypothetical protein
MFFNNLLPHFNVIFWLKFKIDNGKRMFFIIHFIKAWHRILRVMCLILTSLNSFTVTSPKHWHTYIKTTAVWEVTQYHLTNKIYDVKF